MRAMCLNLSFSGINVLGTANSLLELTEFFHQIFFKYNFNTLKWKSYEQVILSQIICNSNFTRNVIKITEVCVR